MHSKLIDCASHLQYLCALKWYQLLSWRCFSAESVCYSTPACVLLIRWIINACNCLHSQCREKAEIQEKTVDSVLLNHADPTSTASLRLRDACFHICASYHRNRQQTTAQVSRQSSVQRIPVPSLTACVSSSLKLLSVRWMLASMWRNYSELPIEMWRYVIITN